MICFNRRRMLLICRSMVIVCCMSMICSTIRMNEQIDNGYNRNKNTASSVIGLTVNVDEENIRISRNIIKNAKLLHIGILSEFFNTTGTNRAIIFQIPGHDNKGDSAIVVGELNAPSALNISVVGYSVGASIREDAVMQAVQGIRPSKLAVCLHGGGNMGIWEPMDAERGRILKLLPDHPTLIFAQSTAYKENSAILRSVQDDFRRHGQLTVLLRDQASYDFAQAHFAAKTVLSPDMALHIGTVPRFNAPLYDIIWLKRLDMEKIPLETPSFPANVSYVVSDFAGDKIEEWVSPHSLAIRDSFTKTFMGLAFLQRGRVLITERLHGHILATLLGMPHVIIDNKFKKLSHFRDTWTADIENTRVASNSQEAVQLALELLEKYSDVTSQKVPIGM